MPREVSSETKAASVTASITDDYARSNEFGRRRASASNELPTQSQKAGSSSWVTPHAALVGDNPIGAHCPG
jgi:hypothetical protein